MCFRIHYQNFSLCTNLFLAFATGAGLRQHFKSQESCKVSKIPGSFSISQRGLPLSSTSDIPHPADSVHYILSENTNQDGSYLPFLNTTENVNMDDKHYIPHGSHDGLITHVDDSGAETTLFLAHESPYGSTNTSVLRKPNPISVDQIVGTSLLQGSLLGYDDRWI